LSLDAVLRDAQKTTPQPALFCRFELSACRLFRQLMHWPAAVTLWHAEFHGGREGRSANRLNESHIGAIGREKSHADAGHAATLKAAYHAHCVIGPMEMGK
jgi:hypothetical protein